MLRMDVGKMLRVFELTFPTLLSFHFSSPRSHVAFFILLFYVARTCVKAQGRLEREIVPSNLASDRGRRLPMMGSPFSVTVTLHAASKGFTSAQSMYQRCLAKSRASRGVEGRAWTQKVEDRCCGPRSHVIHLPLSAKAAKCCTVR